jgi:hypothetical protein
MADVERIKGNVSRMLAAGAPEHEIDTYIAGEGSSPEELRNPYASKGIGQIAKEAVTNIPSSALQYGKDLIQPILHPIETGENIGAIGKGLLQKVGILSGDDSEKYADAVGKYFVDRYGSEEGIKKAIATDPVGILADVATVLTGGGAAIAKTGGVVGKVGETVAAAGRAIDPLTAAGKVATTAGKVGAEVVGGLTGTGGTALKLAAEAGAEGGDAARAFREGFSGTAPEAAVADAKAAVAKIRQERGADYRAGMNVIGADTTVLDFNKIDQAFQRVAAVKNYKGVDLSPTTQAIRDKIGNAVTDWRALDPNDFHTAEGLDALKQKIGDIRDGTQPHTPERIIADQVYHSVKQTIVDQAPKYAEVMKGYEDASKVVKEIETTLSLKPGASIDTSLRKLQSVLRNNVNTNYGSRVKLAEYLVDAGAPNLMHRLAGQSLSSWAPRGLGHVTSAGEIALALHELMNANPKAAAAVAAMLPASSPKLMGGAAFGLGAASRVAKPVARASYLSGRASNLAQ